MKRLSHFLILILLIASTAVAQKESYAYGEPSDLKGLKKIYVDTGPDTKNRDSIIKDLRKADLGFEFVDDEESAEIVLGYGAGEVTRKAIVTGVVVQAKTQRTGTGVVVAHARGKDRLIHSFQDVQQSGWERKPVTNFVREFIKVYKNGNDLK